MRLASVDSILSEPGGIEPVHQAGASAEYPDFIGFGTETVHFGIQAAPADNHPPSVLTWQIDVTDIDHAWSDAARRALAMNSNTTTPLLGWATGGCSSEPPSGYRRPLEGPNE